MLISGHYLLDFGTKVYLAYCDHHIMLANRHHEVDWPNILALVLIIVVSLLAWTEELLHVFLGYCSRLIGATVSRTYVVLFLFLSIFWFYL